MIVYIGIGNSDDKLPQREWVRFQLSTRDALRSAGVQFLGDWHSYPDSIYQNACYAFDIDDDRVPEMQGTLRAIATEFRQDAIAWNQIKDATLFLGKTVHALNHPGSDRWTGGDRKDEP